MKRFGKTSFLMVVLLIAGLLVVGCGDQQQKPLDTDQNGSADQIDPNPSQEQVEVTLYFGDDQAIYLVPETRTIIKDNRTIPQLMVEELIAGPKEDGHSVTIPEGTKLLFLEVEDGIAYVNFSQEVQTNHWGGSAGETMTIYSIVNTLTQLPEIDQVQFLIEGEKQEAIWGHRYTEEPFAASEKIIDPDYR